MGAQLVMHDAVKAFCVYSSLHIYGQLVKFAFGAAVVKQSTQQSTAFALVALHEMSRLAWVYSEDL